MEKIKAIIIPSGNEKQDIIRAEKAIKYNEQNKLNAPYIISGLGPDTNFALGYDKLNKEGNLDFHNELYKFMMEKTSKSFGVDINSLNSIENILYTFPKEQTGKYAIVSYPLHLKRFKEIFETLKEKGKISEEIELEYVPVKETLKEKLYHSIYENLAIKKMKKSLEKI